MRLDRPRPSSPIISVVEKLARDCVIDIKQTEKKDIFFYSAGSTRPPAWPAAYSTTVRSSIILSHVYVSAWDFNVVSEKRRGAVVNNN